MGQDRDVNAHHISDIDDISLSFLTKDSEQYRSIFITPSQWIYNLCVWLSGPWVFYLLVCIVMMLPTIDVILRGGPHGVEILSFQLGWWIAMWLFNSVIGALFVDLKKSKALSDLGSEKRIEIARNILRQAAHLDQQELMMLAFNVRTSGELPQPNSEEKLTASGKTYSDLCSEIADQRSSLIDCIRPNCERFVSSDKDKIATALRALFKEETSPIAAQSRGLRQCLRRTRMAINSARFGLPGPEKDVYDRLYEGMPESIKPERTST